MNKTLGQKLKDLRVQRGMSIQELSKATCITEQYIELLEADNIVHPCGITIKHLAKYFNASLNVLMTYNVPSVDDQEAIHAHKKLWQVVINYIIAAHDCFDENMTNDAKILLVGGMLDYLQKSFELKRRTD